MIQINLLLLLLLLHHYDFPSWRDDLTPCSVLVVSGNIMTLSYSIGLTLGSAVAYLLNVWLGPHLPHNPCQLNGTSYILHTNMSSIEILPETPPADLLPGWTGPEIASLNWQITFPKWLPISDVSCSASARWLTYVVLMCVLWCCYSSQPSPYIVYFVVFQPNVRKT